MSQPDIGKQSDATKAYIKLICEQVRWKKAHAAISQEIEDHLIDQKDAFIAGGFSESEATGKALGQMGDPVTVGSQFDRTYRPKTAWSMIGLTVLALGIGIVIQYLIRGAFIDTGIGGLIDAPAAFYFVRTIVYTIIGVICMGVAYFLDFTIIGKYPRAIWMALTACLLLFPLFGITINGAKIWLPVLMTGTTISLPAFLCLFPAGYAGVIYCMRDKGYAGILLCGVFFALPALIGLTVRGNLSGIFIYTLICFILLLFSIAKGWFSVRRLHGILLVIIPSVIICTVFVLWWGVTYGYMRARLEAMIFSWHDPSRLTYIQAMIEMILDGAKFWGQGAFPAPFEDATRYLPDATTDYLVTYLIYRYGWISFLVITAVLAALILRGLYLCAKQKNVLGRLIATAVLLTLAVQSIVYLSANLGFQIFSQTGLPLISFGGSATIINLILIGIMLSVFKTGELGDVHARMLPGSDGQKRLITIMEGKIIIDLGLTPQK